LAAAELDFCLLGPLLVRRGTLALPVLPGKQRVLLASLLLDANRRLSLDQLAEALWGPAPPSSARGTLRNYVKELRRALADTGAARILTLPGGYLIRVDDTELDLSRFQELRAAAMAARAAGAWDTAAARLRAALALWRGEPLADVPSDWLKARQVPRLAELRQQAAEALIEADLQLGRLPDVLPELRQLVASHPLRERLHRLLMLALYRDGQQGAALVAYRQARQVLLEELGAEPGPELQKLHQQILAADPVLLAPVPAAVRPATVPPTTVPPTTVPPTGPPATGAPATGPSTTGPSTTGPSTMRRSTTGPQAQLPADLADFTGRADQVRQVTGELTALLGGNGAGARPGAVAITAVAGPAGVGKTALAVHAAHLVSGQFPDGQLYLNLRGASRQPVSPGEAVARILRDLGTEPGAVPPDEAERTARYRSLVAGRRLLLVLDDARDAAQVRPLLPGSAGCAVLVTSRRSLADLESARLLHLGVLTAADAAALFGRIVGRPRAAAEPEPAGRVLGLCGGLPLAIRIAAARLTARPDWSIAALAGRLEDTRRRLDELHAGDLAIRTSFLASYDALRQQGGAGRPAPDRAFRLIGLADGPDISLPAAAALLGTTAEATEPALELLADANLLQAASPGRYRCHDLLRIYAAERASAEEDQAGRDQAVRQLLRWYLHTATAATRLIGPHRKHVDPGEPGSGPGPLRFGGYADALDWLDAEHGNLLHAVDQAARQGEHELAWQLCYELWELSDLRGRQGNWIRAYVTGLASARTLGDKVAEAYMLGNLAASYLHAGQPEAALDRMRESLEIMRATGSPAWVATCLVNIGAILTDLGSPEALAPLTEASGLFRAVGNPDGEAFAQCGIAAVHSRHGTFDDAIRHYQLGLDHFRRTSDLGSAGETLVDIGELRLRHGQLGAAVTDATEAAGISRQTGSRRNLARALAVLGRAEAGLDRPELAGQHWREAIEIFTELDSPQAAEIAAELGRLAPQDRLVPQDRRAPSSRLRSGAMVVPSSDAEPSRAGRPNPADRADAWS
jgi:DNA-binding SARP family transcriptional activator/tetratricopeptide (TPR) repeat protein